MESKPGAPYIEKPDQWSADQKDQQKLYCLLNADRVCGGDCVAFDPEGGVEMRTGCLIVNALVSQAAILSSIRKILDSRKHEPIPGVKVPPPDVRT